MRISRRPAWPLSFGSSRNSGKSGPDFEEEAGGSYESAMGVSDIPPFDSVRLGRAIPIFFDELYPTRELLGKVRELVELQHPLARSCHWEVD